MAITPEYNHAPSPALLNILNHFGSSVFSWKASAIVSYSAGQWGGSGAALALRPVLSELGCLPVSALVHVPNAGSVFDEDGSVIGDEEEAVKWLGYGAMRRKPIVPWWTPILSAPPSARIHLRGMPLHRLYRSVDCTK